MLRNGPRLCDVDLLDDPHHVFEVVGIDESTNSGVNSALDFDFPAFLSMLCKVGPDTYVVCSPGQAPLDAYWLNPDPLRAALWTTGNS
jgi:hypothetical protein